MNYKSTNMTKDRHIYIFTCCIHINIIGTKGGSKKKKKREKRKHQLKSILRQQKNYENSNILPCKNIIFKTFSQTKSKSFKIL